MSEQQIQPQDVPVRIFQSEHRLMLVAPMPGLEPEDISVVVDGNQVVIRGEKRGPHQDDVDLVTAEWTIGPYYRECTLPAPVDGARCNASYGNGVLVLTMPKLAPNERGTRGEFRLEPVQICEHGEHVGHVGRNLRSESTEEHVQKTRR